MTSCPFCGCDRIYPLMETLRCKRCKGIWKADAAVPGCESSCGPAPDPLIRKRTDPLKTRLEKRLEECLSRSRGRYCPAARPWQAGDITEEQFTRYLRQCVNERRLAGQKDRYGRTWYYRPR